MSMASISSWLLVAYNSSQRRAYVFFRWSRRLHRRHAVGHRRQTERARRKEDRRPVSFGLAAEVGNVK